MTRTSQPMLSAASSTPVVAPRMPPFFMSPATTTTVLPGSAAGPEVGPSHSVTWEAYFSTISVAFAMLSACRRRRGRCRRGRRRARYRRRGVASAVRRGRDGPRAAVSREVRVIEGLLGGPIGRIGRSVARATGSVIARVHDEGDRVGDGGIARSRVRRAALRRVARSDPARRANGRTDDRGTRARHSDGSLVGVAVATAGRTGAAPPRFRCA